MDIQEDPEFFVSASPGPTAFNSVVAEVADIYQTGELGHHLHFPIYENRVRSIWLHRDIPLKYGLTSNEFPLVLGCPTQVVVFRTLHPRDSKTLTDFDLDFPPELLAEYFRVGQDWVWKNIQEPAERLGPDGGEWDRELELVEYQPRVHFDSASGATTYLSWSTGKSFWVRGRVGQQSTKSWAAAESEPSSPYMLIPKAVARVVLDLFDSHQVNVRDLAGILLSPSEHSGSLTVRIGDRSRCRKTNSPLIQSLHFAIHDRLGREKLEKCPSNTRYGRSRVKRDPSLRPALSPKSYLKIS
jgi:hypothetical protein